MSFVNGKSIVENNIEQGNKLNPFSGCSEFLNSKFKTVFSFNEKVVNSPQNFNVQSNPFNNTEKIDASKQLIGGHSIDYVMSENSIFDNKISNHTMNTENFRNQTGNLNFES